MTRRKRRFPISIRLHNIHQKQIGLPKLLINFVVAHNNKFKIKVPDEGWSSTNFNHQIQADIYDSGVFILNFAKQFLASTKMSQEIDPNEYRLELQHLVLRKASNMKDKCVICGYKVPPNFEREKVYWIQCCSCDRWDHIPCAELNTKGLEDKFTMYFCFICKASANMLYVMTLIVNLSHKN